MKIVRNRCEHMEILTKLRWPTPASLIEIRCKKTGEEGIMLDMCNPKCEDFKPAQCPKQAAMAKRGMN
jgi:hypothetical protein